MIRRFIGEYMTDDGPIRLDENAKVQDLLMVIEKLNGELNWWKKEAMGKQQAIIDKSESKGFIRYLLGFGLNLK